jgi:hypothetical protein
MIYSSLFEGYYFAITAYTQRAFLAILGFLKHPLNSIEKIPNRFYRCCKVLHFRFELAIIRQSLQGTQDATTSSCRIKLDFLRYETDFLPPMIWYIGG